MPNEKMTETLKAIETHEPTTASQIAETLNKSTSTAHRRISELESKDWIQKKKLGRSKQISLTEQGSQALEIAPRGQKTRECQDSKDTKAGEIRAHGYAVEFGIHSNVDRSEWTRKVIESSNLRFRELEDGSDLVYFDDYSARVRPEKVVFRVDGEIGSDAHQLADRLLEKIQKCRDDFESRTGIKLSYHPRNHRVRVKEQEFAIIRHPFAEALIEDSDLNASDVQFFEEDDNHELWVDDSKGNKELETGRAAPYDEEDIQLLKEDLEHKVQNPENTRRRQELPSELDDLEDDLDERISEIERATRVLLSRELRRDREAEKDKQGGKKQAERKQDHEDLRTRRESPSVLRVGREYSKRLRREADDLVNLFWRASFSARDLLGSLSFLRSGEP